MYYKYNRISRMMKRYEQAINGLNPRQKYQLERMIARFKAANHPAEPYIERCLKEWKVR